MFFVLFFADFTDRFQLACFSHKKENYNIDLNVLIDVYDNIFVITKIKRKIKKCN